MSTSQLRPTVQVQETPDTRSDAHRRPTDPHTLGRGRYWVFVSGRRWDRGADARREEWHRHVDGHPPWKKGAAKDPSCTYCAAVRS